MMKSLQISHRCFLQILRDPSNLLLSLGTTPFVLILYKFTSLRIESNSPLNQVGNNQLSFPNFQEFVPGILILSLILSIFPFSMAITEEMESKTVVLLRLAGHSTKSILFGLFIPFFLLGLFGFSLSLLCSWLLGFDFNPSGDLLLTVTIGVFSLMSVGVTIGSFAKNKLQSFYISSLVMFSMVVFSGVVFPKPNLELLTITDFNLNTFHFLPSTSISENFSETLRSQKNFNITVKGNLMILLLLGIFYSLIGYLLFRRTENQILRNSI